jgi:anti-sigma regulatory factor (Ser/Thr protein kinase)
VTGAAPQSSRRIELHFAATREGFAAAFDELRLGLDRLGLQGRPRFSVELVFEEVVANVVRHGARPDGRTAISLEVLLQDDAVQLTFLDDGRAFDPRQRSDPAPPRDLEHAEIGGRGLMLIRSVCKGLEYARTPEGQNRLTVTVSKDATGGAGMSDGARSGA